LKYPEGGSARSGLH